VTISFGRLGLRDRRRSDCVEFSSNGAVIAKPNKGDNSADVIVGAEAIAVYEAEAIPRGKRPVQASYQSVYQLHEGFLG
jgi:hypothetical protein